MKKKKIYIAAPLFNEQERQFNKKIKNLIKKDLYQLYLPQEDGLLLEDILKENSFNIDTAKNEIYLKDINAMDNSDTIIAVLDGSNIDEGVAFEIGYMKAKGKITIGLQTDVRRQLPSGNNPMIQKGLDYIFNSLEEMLIHINEE